jgi:hypothetical protein
LIRYLLDELHSYEEDHSDALCPVQREAQGSLLGEHVLVRPVSTEEVRLLHTSISSDVKGVHNEMGAMRAAVNDMMTSVNTFVNSRFPQPAEPSGKVF